MPNTQVSLDVYTFLLNIFGHLLTTYDETILPDPDLEIVDHNLIFTPSETGGDVIQ